MINFIRHLMPVIALASLIFAVPPAQGQSADMDMASLTADQLIARADAFRNPLDDTRIELSLREFTRDQEAATEAMIVYTKGADKSMVELLAPRVRGQKVLMTAEALWLFIPTTKRAVRITPAQRLLGQASFGDVTRLQWRSDYDVHFASDNEGGKLTSFDNNPAIGLILTAKTKNATYAKIHLLVDAKTARPLSADHYAVSGKLLKTAHYQNYISIDLMGISRETFGLSDYVGPLIEVIATRTIFYDGVASHKKTIMNLRKIAPSNLPDYRFTRAGISR